MNACHQLKLLSAAPDVNSGQPKVDDEATEDDSAEVIDVDNADDTKSEGGTGCLSNYGFLLNFFNAD